MNTGWIKLHRSILEWEWWRERDTRDLFIYCLLAANHDEQRQFGMTIPRGTFITSRKKLADGAGISEQAVRTSLIRLERTQNLTVQSTNQHTVITICNYNKYQAKDTVEQPTANQENNQPINQRPTSDQPDTTQKSTIEATKQPNAATDYNTTIYQQQETYRQPTNQPTTNQPTTDNPSKINQPTNQQINHKQEDIKNILRREEEEKNLSHSQARAREEAQGGVVMPVRALKAEVEQEVKNNGQLVSSMASLYGITPEQIKTAVSLFTDKLIADGSTYRSRSDFRRYFNSWLKCNVKQIFFNDNNNGNRSPRNHQPQYSAEFLAGIAADIASGS